MSLTRNALKHKKVRSVACGPAGAGRLEGLQVEQDANCDRGGCREWSAHSAPRFQCTSTCRALPPRRSRPRGNRNNLDIDHVEDCWCRPLRLSSRVQGSGRTTRRLCGRLGERRSSALVIRQRRLRRQFPPGQSAGLRAMASWN
jgi:hypothetical protein